MECYIPHSTSQYDTPRISGSTTKDISSRGFVINTCGSEVTLFYRSVKKNPNSNVTSSSLLLNFRETKFGKNVEGNLAGAKFSE